MKLLVAPAFLFLCTPAFAEQFYLVTTLRCNPSKPELVVSFRGAWNEEGEMLVGNLGPNDVDPWKLITFTKDEASRYSIHTRSVRKTCRMNGQDYRVEFSPLTAPGFQPEGLCATRVGTQVSVWSRGRIVASAGFDACSEQGLMIRTLSLSPNKKPRYEKTAAWEFINGS